MLAQAASLSLNSVRHVSVCSPQRSGPVWRLQPTSVPDDPQSPEGPTPSSHLGRKGTPGAASECHPASRPIRRFVGVRKEGCGIGGWGSGRGSVYRLAFNRLRGTRQRHSVPDRFRREMEAETFASILTHVKMDVFLARGASGLRRRSSTGQRHFRVSQKT